MRSIGADHVTDYSQDDFASGEERYDLILDIGGNSRLSRLRRALTPHGTLVVVGGEGRGRWIGLDRQLRALALSPFVGQRLTMLGPKEHYTVLERLTELIENGQLVPVIEQTYPLSEMPNAMRHLEAGRARGKLVISVNPTTTTNQPDGGMACTLDGVREVRHPDPRQPERRPRARSHVHQPRPPSTQGTDHAPREHTRAPRVPVVENAASREQRAHPSPTAAAELAATFKALADPTRVAIVNRLAAGECCVCDLTAAFELSQPTVSHHLRILRDAGLVEAERRGTWAYYRLLPLAIERLRGTFSASM